MASKGTDYEAEKQKLKEFLANFATTDEQGKKVFKYAEQLTAIAHRYPAPDPDPDLDLDPDPDPDLHVTFAGSSQS